MKLGYYKKYHPPLVAVDAIVVNGKGEILLLKRKINPFRGLWVVPGGHVEYGETVEEAVIREVLEETGLKCKIVRLLGVYSDPRRDPRFHTVSAAFVLKIVSGKLKNSFESTEQKFFSWKNLPQNLGFDHRQILKDYLRSK